MKTMQIDKHMETVVITGASRGIGLELTRQFIEAGFAVVASYRGKPSAELEALSCVQLTLLELEVTSQSSIDQFARMLDQRSIDVVINNAGVIGADEQSMQSIDAQQWLDTLAVNTVAPLMVSRALLPMMKQSNNPRIITVSSQMGSLNPDSTGMYAYRSSKAAVNKVMQVLAVELKAQGVIVCPLHPGWVKTDMGGEEADITAQESAAGILKLVQQVTLEQSGTFFTWQGEVHDW